MHNKQTSLSSFKNSKTCVCTALVTLSDSSSGLHVALSDQLFTDAGVSMDRLGQLFIVCTFLLCHHMIW